MRDIYAPFHSNLSPRLVSPSGVKIREDTLFTNQTGEEKRGIRKRAEKALQKLEELLRKVLEPEETVLYVAQAQAPVSVFEQFTLGWYAYYVSRSVVVLTNRRLLHFSVKRDGSWDGRLRSTHWGDVAEAEVKGWLSPALEIKYHSGHKEKYWGLRRVDAKKIKFLLATLLPASAGEATPAQDIVSLCVGCLAPLTPQVYQCDKCGMTFKDERTMVWRSLLIPGGGYFYTQQWFLGVGDFMVEVFLLWVVVFWALIAAGVLKETPRPGEAPATAGGALLVAVVFLGILAFEKLLTIYHCRRRIREFIPKA